MFRLFFVFFLALVVTAASPAFAQKPKARGQSRIGSSGSEPKNLGEGTARLVKRQVTPTVEVHLPANFAPLSLDAIAAKYPSFKKPHAVYSDPNGAADFIVSGRRSDFPAQDMELLRKFYKASILNMFSEVEFLTEKTEVINKREYVILEFLSTMKEEENAIRELKPMRKYTYLMYTLEDELNLLTVFTIQAQASQKETWREMAPRIMATLKMKDTPKPKEQPKAAAPAPKAPARGGVK